LPGARRHRGSLSGGTKGAELRNGVVTPLWKTRQVFENLTGLLVQVHLGGTAVSADSLTGQRAARFLQARDAGQPPYSRSTNCPSNSVATTCVSRMAIGSMLKMSWESTTRSASLPGASVPLIASSPLA